MTDEPRFEPVRGEPKVAHEVYYGGGLVSLVFRLVDRWMAVRRQSEANAPAAANAGGGIEIHERPIVRAPAAGVLPGAAEAAERTFYQISPEETFSGNFLIGSAQTMKVQAGLLAAFVGVLVVLLVQGLPQPNQRILVVQEVSRQAAP